MLIGAKQKRQGQTGSVQEKRGGTRTYVFLHDLVEAGFERIPREDFDVLLDAAGLGHREFHEELEKLGQLCSRNGGGVYELEVASNTTLLIERGPPVNDETDEPEYIY